MASLSLKHIYKVYDGNVKAVNDFSMEIKDKEFIVFVGPSGCGKSTTLRMIAGLEEITAGELKIDGVLVNSLEPKDRNIAMVFQNYALYPHMSVYENMAFALKTAKVRKKVIHEKIIEAAEILGITEYLDRKPKALSGGQRQRVALGRAIVRNPKVFLLDEPLSNLDAKLRASMRAEILRLHHKLQTTFIYVTHDQVEAMTMGTRIVVMKDGYVQQIDTPQNLYRHPVNKFVASFIGTPQMNFFNGTISKKEGKVFYEFDCGLKVEMDELLLEKVIPEYLSGTRNVCFGIRPDDIMLDGAEYGKFMHKATAVVSVTESLGGETLVYANFNTDNIDSKEGQFTVKVRGECSASWGEKINVLIDKRKIYVFDKETGASVKLQIPRENTISCKIKSGRMNINNQTFNLPPALCKTKDGIAKIIIPAAAVVLGEGEGKAEITNVEKFTNETLYSLKVGNINLFATEMCVPRFNKGDSVDFDVDFSMIYSEEALIHPVKRNNNLPVKFVKKRRDKKYDFYFETEGKSALVPESIKEKLFSSKGTDVFDAQIELLFGNNGFITEKTLDYNNDILTGTVEEILDYGRKIFASISIGNHTAVLQYDGKPGDAVKLKINDKDISVIDKKLNITLV